MIQVQRRVNSHFGVAPVTMTVFGIISTVRDEIASPLAPRERVLYEQSLDAARAALGDEAAFDRAWQEGQAMPLHEAVEFALRETSAQA